MKKILSLIIILLFVTYAQGQDKANEYYEAGYFREASIVFEKEINRGKGNKDPLKLKLADCYFQMKEIDESIDIYQNLYQNGNKDSITLIRLVELNRALCKYDEAEKYYTVYKEEFASTSEEKHRDFSEKQINFPRENNKKDQGIELVELKLPQVIKGMGYTLLKNGDIIAGIYKENKEKKTTFTTLGKFSVASNFQNVEEYQLNKKLPFFTAYPSYSKATNTLYFTANISKKRMSFKGNENVLQIYAINTKSKDNEPELLSFNSPQYNFTHPTISEDGKKLYFVSDRPEGYGGYDIYYVEKTDNGWSEIKNCGANVNTQFDELTPFLTGDSLFFSSYGHQNYGGSDIFLSIHNNGEFSTAHNLGLPVNSCKDDFSFHFNAENGEAMLTSNRKNSTIDDIYIISFPLSPNKVTDQKTGNPLADVSILFNNQEALNTDESGEWMQRIPLGRPATIKFDNPYYETKIVEYDNVSENDIEEIQNIALAPVMISGKTKDDITGNPLQDVTVSLYERIGNDWVLVEEVKTDKDGNWEFHIRKDKEYKVELSKESYLTASEIIPSHDDKNSSKQREEALKRLNPFSMKYEAKKDLVIQIDNIYFDLNSSYIQKDSYQVVEKLKGFLEDNPDIKIELSAHTDCNGKKDYNLWLSNRRAERTKEYLVKQGIAPGRIVAKGYGQQRMIVTDCELQKKDDSEAQKNRRVEVKIL